MKRGVCLFLSQNSVIIRDISFSPNGKKFATLTSDRKVMMSESYSAAVMVDTGDAR